VVTKTIQNLSIHIFKPLVSKTFQNLSIPRSPGFFTGWDDVLGGPGSKDATPAVLMALLLFIIPSNPNFLAIFKSSAGPESVSASPALVYLIHR
jgi:hypothetical protein